MRVVSQEDGGKTVESISTKISFIQKLGQGKERSVDEKEFMFICIQQMRWSFAVSRLFCVVGGDLRLMADPAVTMITRRELWKIIWKKKLSQIQNFEFSLWPSQ